MLNTIKQLLSMAFPMMSSRLVQTAQGFIIMVLLAQLGHTILAASLTMSLFRIVIVVTTVSTLFSVGAIASRQFGAKNYTVLPSLLIEAWLTGLCLSVVSMLMLGFIRPLLILCHQPPAVIPYITTYFHLLIFAMPAISLFVANQQFLMSIKRQHLVTLLSIFLLAMSFIFNYGLILGHFGMPRLGVYGAGLAAIISSWLLTLVSMMMVYRLMPGGFSLQNCQLQSFVWAKQIVKIGLPICLHIATDMTTLFIFTVMTGWFGEIAMGAAQISSEYMLFLIVPIFGLSEACCILVGHAVGSKNFPFISQLAKAGVSLALSVTIIVAICFAVFHHQIAAVFIHFNSHNAMAIYHLALMLLGIRIVSMCFDSIANVITGLLRGLFDTKFPMRVSLLTNWLIAIPVAFLFSLGFQFGVIGIAIGGLTGRLIHAIILSMRWQQRERRQLMPNCGASKKSV